MGFVRVQTQAIFRHPSADIHQGGVGLFAAAAKHHEVVRVSHYPMSQGRHALVQRVQVDVRQQRADYRTLRRA